MCTLGIGCRSRNVDDGSFSQLDRPHDRGSVVMFRHRLGAEGTLDIVVLDMERPRNFLFYLRHPRVEYKTVALEIGVW